MFVPRHAHSHHHARSGGDTRVSNAAPRHRLRAALALVLVTTLYRAPAHAQPGDTARALAAAAYDEGAELFDRAQYADAAQAFLRADAHVPSSDAVNSALIAAGKSDDHLLVVKVAERAITRETADPRLAARARQALLEAARHLSRVELECAPKPCELSVDGGSVTPGPRYVLPGTHAVSARGANGASDEERFTMQAGVSYRLVLHPVNATQILPTTNRAQGRRGVAETHSSPPSDRGAQKPLSPIVFYAGTAVTVALIALTTWSGVDTLSAKHDLPKRPTEEDIDDVKAKIRRTDIALGGTILAGALTTYAGIELVDWGSASSTNRGTLEPVPRGAVLNVSGRF